MEKVITLIGGGAASIAFLDSFVNSLPKDNDIKFTVYVIEKRAAYGPGAAYSDDLKSNILNTKAGFITIYPYKPGDFYNWLTCHPEAWKWKFPQFKLHPDTYAPRPLFGDYLRYSFSQVINKGIPKNVRVIQVNAEAIQVTKFKSQYLTRTECNIDIRSDYVMLLCGTLENKRRDSPKMDQGIISNPYPVSKLTSFFGREKSVAIIGSRLSAIDTVIALKEAGHTGKITIYSRSGYFPSVRGTQGRFTPQLFTPEHIDSLPAHPGCLSLADLALMVKRDLELYFEENPEHPREDLSIPEPPTSLTAFLAREIDLATHPRGWQAVLYATNAIVDKLWYRLNEESKRTFASKYMSAFLSYRVSIPRENAIKIYNYLLDGSLEFKQGETQIDTSDSGQPFVRLSDGLKCTHDYIVIATGSPKRAKDSDSPLLEQMEAQGYIQPHPYGGIKVCEQTYRTVDTSNNYSNGIYAVGEITSGQFFFTSALDIICRHSNLCASAFVESIIHEPNLHDQYAEMKNQ